MYAWRTENPYSNAFTRTVRLQTSSILFNWEIGALHIKHLWFDELFKALHTCNIRKVEAKVKIIYKELKKKYFTKGVRNIWVSNP